MAGADSDVDIHKWRTMIAVPKMSEREFTPGWRPVHVGFECECRLSGAVNPWDYEWTLVDGDSIVVPHPSYPQQRHDATIYEIVVAGRRIRFAFDELSNGVYGFYEPIRPAPSV